MNNQFDELTEGIAQSMTRGGVPKNLGVRFAGMALAGLLALPAAADDLRLGPLVELSRPNAVGTCDDGLGAALPGRWALDDAAEPFVAVNPVNPRNIVAVWIQGPFQNIISAASLDGGRTWQQTPVPLTLCSGGPFLGAGDPWLSFAPNGDLYAIAVTGNSFDNPSTAVNKSTDGGLHWSAATLIYEPPDAITGADKPSITAEPADARLVYAVWEVNSNDGGVSMFARSTDGGQSWEPARQIYDPGLNNLVTDQTIMVLPDNVENQSGDQTAGGTLVDFFTEFRFNDISGLYDTTLSSLRSVDHGQTWSSVTRGPSIPTMQVTDPDTGHGVNSLGSFTQFFGMAMDRRNGKLYLVWEDTQFSGGQYSSVAFSMSTDGGLSWSVPIPVNQTPHDIAPGNRQAFLPSVAVASDGTIGVSYYDFRFNDSHPGLPTDCWLVQCRPSRRAPATNPANWGDEVRLTPISFDMERAIVRSDAYFVGDYEGLAAIGNDFVTVFNGVDRDNVTSIFFRRVAPEGRHTGQEK